MRRLSLLSLLVLLIACQPISTLTPFAASAVPIMPTQVIQIVTPMPTRTPRSIWATRPPTPIPTLMPTDAQVPTLPSMILATLNDGLAPTWTPWPTWTPPPLDPVAHAPSHFMLEWPVANGAYALNRVYPYGGTDGGRLQVHHGVDLINPLGTPIHAAGDGTVIYAGNDFVTLFGPQPNYYGNLVVIQHNFLSPEGLPVFTLYGHMDGVAVHSGQLIRQGDEIGTVGATGIALGPHVHVEVRLGNPFDFGATRNPELWLRLSSNSGLLAGRVNDAYGNLAYNVALTVVSDGTTRRAYSYGDGSVNPDAAFGENFTLGNLPPDYYVVSVTQDGRERFTRTVYVYPDQVTWLDAQLMP